MKNRKGFTIVELVIVIAVIAILAAVLIPTFSGVIQKANDSAALQEATSTMKSALAMSQSGTLADNTLFLVGDNSGIVHSYVYSGNSIGEDTNNTIKDGEFETALIFKNPVENSAQYNTIIINDKLATAMKTATTGGDQAKVCAMIKGALGIETLATLAVVPSGGETGVATGASYKLVDNKGTADVDTDDVTWSVFVNSDFAKDVVVFTFAN